MNVDRVEALPEDALAQPALIDLADHVDGRAVEIRNLGRALKMPGMVDVFDHDKADEIGIVGVIVKGEALQRCDRLSRGQGSQIEAAFEIADTG